MPANHGRRRRLPFAGRYKQTFVYLAESIPTADLSLSALFPLPPPSASRQRRREPHMLRHSESLCHPSSPSPMAVAWPARCSRTVTQGSVWRRRAFDGMVSWAVPAMPLGPYEEGDAAIVMCRFYCSIIVPIAVAPRPF